VSISKRGEQLLAEAIYKHFRGYSTREQMAQMIDMLLSDKAASPLMKNVIIRMAMIFSAEEGHS
jgi:uncharacterized membrane protein (UPF0127 family)